MAEASTTSTSQKNIVILGGSYGGLSVAHSLLKHTIPNLPEKASYRVIIVSASSKAFDRPACPRALISDEFFDQSKLFVDTTKQFEQYPKENFQFIHGTASEVNHTNRVVSIAINGGGSQNLNYHTLVVATGSSTPSPLLSINRDEDYIRNSWKSFRAALPTAKTIVIAGAGPAGIETAGELGEYLNGKAGMFSEKLTNPKVKITVLTSGDKILPILRDSLAKKAEEMLAKVGVTIVRNSKVKSLSPEGAGTTDPASKATITLEDGNTMEADLYIPATGMTPNTSFLDKSLLTADGRVDTNAQTLRVEKAGVRVYAVGDVGSFARPAVHNIFAAVPVVSRNIKKDLLLDSGKQVAEVGEDKIFKEDTRETQLVPIGKSGGVGAVMGYFLPSFLVWAIKGRDYWLWTMGGLWSGKQWAKET